MVNHLLVILYDEIDRSLQRLALPLYIPHFVLSLILLSLLLGAGWTGS